MKNLESGNSDLQAHLNSRMLILAVTPTMALQIKKVYNPLSEVWHPRNVSIRNKLHREFKPILTARIFLFRRIKRLPITNLYLNLL